MGSDLINVILLLNVLYSGDIPLMLKFGIEKNGTIFQGNEILGE